MSKLGSQLYLFDSQTCKYDHSVSQSSAVSEVHLIPDLAFLPKIPRLGRETVSNVADTSIYDIYSQSRHELLVEYGLACYPLQDNDY